MLRKRILALLVCWLASPLVLALGLGPVTTNSALNEPFEGRIEILNAIAEDFDNLTVGLAGADHFDRAGVVLNPVLLKLKFEFGQPGVGADHITISSKDPIREPFLNFLLELNWSNGRLLREYTVLLDPPLYDPNRGMAPEAPPAAPAALVDVPPPLPPSDEETMAPTPAPTRVVTPAGYAPGKEIGPAVATDTLWSFASAYRPSEDISVQQMMLAILRANPEGFSNDNVNMLRHGAVLRLPDEAEITSLSVSEAFAEAKRQHQLWEEYRQQVAQTPALQPLGADRGAPTYAGDGDAADARLELVAPGAGEGGSTPGDAAGGAGTDLLREQLDGRSQQNVELLEKLTEAEEIIDLLQRQVNIQDEELAALQARLAELGIEHGDIGVAAAPDAAVEEPALEASVADEGPVADEPVIEDQPVAEEPALVDEPVVAAPPAARGFPANLIPEHIAAMVPGGALTVLGVVAIVILALFVMVVQFLMRAIGARTAEPADEPRVAVEVDDDTEDPTLTAPTATPEEEGRQAAAVDAAVAEEPEETIPPEAQTIEAEAASLSGQTQEQEAFATPAVEEDPLEEVNVYLAYERFDQAEELVKRVIAEFPDRHEYKLRLLEVYYSSNNKAAYEDAARSVQDAVGEDDALWESALAMWSEMSPERALFEAGAEPEAAAADAPEAAAPTFVDITQATDTDDILDLTVANIEDDGDVLDISAADEEILDVTGQAAAGDDAPQSADVTAETTAEEAGGDSDLLDVTKTGDISTVEDSDLLNVTSQSMGGADLLDITTGDAADESPLDITDVRDAGDDQSLDFDISDTVAPAFNVDAGPVVEEPAAAEESADLDFDIGGLELEDSEGEEAPDDVAAALDPDDIPTVDLDSAVAEMAAAVAEPDIDSLEFDITVESEDGVDELSSGEKLDLSGDLDLDITVGDDIDDSGLDLDLTVGEEGAGGGLDLDITVDDEKPTAGELDPTDLSLQGAELDELALAADGESEDFDFSLEGTSEMDGIMADDTIDMASRDGGEEAALDMGDDASLDDLALELDESLTDTSDLGSNGLEGLALEGGDGDHLQTLEMDTDGPPAEDLGSEKTVVMPLSDDIERQSDADETDTKLDLAKAYIELGDSDGARTLLDEVARDGNDAQKAEAQSLLDQLS